MRRSGEVASMRQHRDGQFEWCASRCSKRAKRPSCRTSSKCTGRPYAVPALREAPVQSSDVARLVKGVASGRFSIVIFQTGVVAQRLFDEAERAGVLADVRERLGRCTTVCRGPKPAAALARNGVKPTVTTAEPYTTRELLLSLSSIDVSRKYVALLHYGEQNRPLAIALRTSGARLAEFLLYEWRLPEDLGPLQQMVEDIIAGRRCDRYESSPDSPSVPSPELMGTEDELAHALIHRVVIASIGLSCSHHLARSAPAECRTGDPEDAAAHRGTRGLLRPTTAKFGRPNTLIRHRPIPVRHV